MSVSPVSTGVIFGADEFTVVRSQDVGHVLDANKDAQNDGTNGWTKSRTFRYVAEIPLVLAEKWKNELGVDVFNQDHKAAVRRLLNDPDYAYLRTSGGKLKR